MRSAMCNGARALLSDRAARRFFARFYDWQAVTAQFHAPRRNLHENRLLYASRTYQPAAIWHDTRDQRAKHTASFNRVSRGVSIQRRRSATDATALEPDVEKLDLEKNNVNATEDVDVSKHSKPFTTDTVYQRHELSPHMRLLMRHTPSSVVVITSLANKDPRKVVLRNKVNFFSEGFRGMTVSSFTTVTLDPKPIVSFNVKLPSRTFKAIEFLGQFKVHFLAANQQGAFIANAFAQSLNGGREAFEALADESNKAVTITVNRSGHWRGLVPRIRGPGIRAVATCTLLNQPPRTQVGDHVIVLAEVDKVTVEENAPDGMGILYGEGAYHEIGTPIPKQLKEHAEPTEWDPENKQGLPPRIRKYESSDK